MLLLVVGVLVGAWALPVDAQQRVRIDVVEVSGLLDPVQVDFVTDALRDAQRHGAEALVVRLDSPDAVVDDEDITVLTFRIVHSEVPVAIWVGPGTGAEVGGKATALFRAARVKGAAPGADVPNVGGVISAATLGDFIVALDGKAGIDVPTEIIRREGRPPQQQLAAGARVAFDEPSLLAQLLHAVAAPSVAYLLLTVGLVLLVFDFFTGGVGVAGGVGVVALLLSGYGLGVLPTRPIGVVLLAVGVLGHGIDIQAGAPRTWAGIGTIAFALGSVLLYGDGIRVPWLVLVLVVAGLALFMVAGLPGVVRTRYSTATVGRESMIGEVGRAVSDVAPDGTVEVRSAPWRARTNRATPIKAGDEIRVAAIDGLLLEVEPLEGAAKDAGH